MCYVSGVSLAALSTKSEGKSKQTKGDQALFRSCLVLAFFALSCVRDKPFALVTRYATGNFVAAQSDEL